MRPAEGATHRDAPEILSVRPMIETQDGPRRTGDGPKKDTLRHASDGRDGPPALTGGGRSVRLASRPSACPARGGENGD